MRFRICHRLEVRLLGAVLSGVLLRLSFPDPGWGFLAGIALVPLFLSLRGKTWKSRLLLGFVFGAVFFGLLLSWLRFVHPAAVFLACLVLAFYSGLWAVAVGRLRSVLRMVVWIPVCWTAVEYSRSIGPIGFGWGLLGYTQWENLPLIQMCSVLGVYGPSLLIASVNGAVASLPMALAKRSPRHWLLVAVPFLILAVAWLWGVSSLRRDFREERDTVRLGLVQTCFGQQDKWSANRQEDLLAGTFRLTHQAAQRGVDLVVWPETALPLVLDEFPAVERQLIHTVERLGVPILAGALVKDSKAAPESPKTFNAAILYLPGADPARARPEYDKIHLVPWGEYVPLERFFPFAGRLVSQEGGGGIDPGDRLTVFRLDGATFSVPICFESTVPDLVRKFALAGAGFLVNITNDAWFRKSSAQDLHMIQSVFRAVENRRWVVRAANTGRTCVIDPRGRVVSRLALYAPGVLVAEVEPLGITTWYTRLGDWPARLVLGLWIVGLLLPACRTVLAGRTGRKTPA